MKRCLARSPSLQNFQEAPARDGSLRAGVAVLPWPQVATATRQGQKLQLGIRPEHHDQSEDPGAPSLPISPGLPITVEVVERLGGTAFVHGRRDSGEALVAEHCDTSAARRPHGAAVRRGACCL